MKNELEDVLSVLSYSLRPLSRNDQVMFIKNYWCNILGFSIKQNFERFTNELQVLLPTLISDKNKEFTGIPLQTKMLAEAFHEKFKTSYDLSNNKESNISIKLDLRNLYGAFVESKYKRHLSEKKKWDLSKSGSECETLAAFFMKKYSLLALCELFDEEDLNQLLVQEELKTIKLSKIEIQEGNENSGFISHIVATKPIFIHFSFAEYFAALFFSKNIERKEVTKFFCHHVYGEEHNLTSIFFDQIVTADEHTCKMHIAVLSDDGEKVKQLLSNAEKAKDFINAVDKVGRTALHLAAAYGNFYLVKTLLGYEFRVDAKDHLLGWRPLRYADKDGHWVTVELLLRKGANAGDMYEAMKSLETYDVENPKKTLLHKAAKKSLVKILENLIENKINLINVVDENGCTPLHYAANEEVAELLIKRGANIKAKNMFEKSPLHYAVQHHKYEVVELLIREGADVEAKSDRDETPLFFTTSKKAFELLIANGADINAKSRGNNTPLHFAVMNRKDEIVELLLKKGADVEAKNCLDETPLFSAGTKKTFELLTAHGADINAENLENNTPLHFAVMNRKDEIVKLLLKKGADVEAKNCLDETPLFSAGTKKTFELLIAHGADINAKSSEGYTPLHFAVMNRKDEIVELLLKKGADVEAKNCDDETPLFSAGTKKAFELLIAHGADINAKSSDGSTPLHFALTNGEDEVVELLIKEGADVEAKYSDDRTPLFLADGKKAFELLIAHGADINAKSSEGYTPLHFALMIEEDEVVELLIKEGADVEAKDSEDKTPLFFADSKKAFELLVAISADINAKSSEGYTLLHNSVKNGNDEIVELLITEGADVEAKSNHDETPMFFTVSKNVFELLIAKGANINAKSSEGYTPLHSAVMNGRDEVVELLIKEGADVEDKDYFERTPIFYARSKRVHEFLIANGADIEAINGESLYADGVGFNEYLIYQPCNDFPGLIQKFSIKENFELYANKLLDKVLQSISDKNKEFTGIPLQTKMLIEAFQEKIKTFYDQFNKNESNISIKLDLMNLYRAFVESKYKRHLLEKQILNLSKSGPEYDTLFASFEKKYSLLALCILFHEEDLNQFLIEEELETIKLLKRQIQEGKENSGFISHIVAAKPIFIHFSFAEYFAAHFYSKNIKRKEVTKFFCHQVYGKEHNLTRIFFDQMVTADKYTCKMHIAVLNNDIEKVKQLLSNAEKAKDFVNAADKVGRTALHLAAAYGNFYMVKTLLNHEFRADAEDQLLGWRPLRYADKDGHWETVELLLRKGANACDICEAIKSLETYDAEKPKKILLHEAAQTGLVDLLEALIESKINMINVVDERGWSPLHYAAYEKVANLLIKRGADIEAKDMYGEAPLHWAVRQENIGVVELLIKEGADVEAKGYHNETPLFSARSKKVFELLIAKGANINAKNSKGYTPLHSALMNERDEVTELLIREGADVEAKGYHNETPLFTSKSKKAFELLITKGADINAKSSEGYTPLHCAVMKGRDEIVELLIKQGADVEAKCHHNETPLFSARSKKVFELLIAKGANINAKSSEGYTPLHRALMNERDEVVELLIKEGADVEAKCHHDETPLFSAGSKKAFEHLIAKGANINAKSSEGYTPLHNALMKRRDEVVDLLVKEGADFEAKDYRDETPLFKASTKKMFELLIEKGANINARNNIGKTLLHSAVLSEEDEIVELLLKKGADVEAKDCFGSTPLFAARSKKVFELLTAKGANINVKCSNGLTLLHYALLIDNEEVSELLIKKRR
ncbi:serine/threonine-protein phosphatase 6 regulatory ankyrin repeat subunit B-like [Parasteatoda tepidariorum]|uniref:serine/threonine-protein phosphatase 6 regulatory ankyrin repeat subunit B-like n=1 Tax=Parasteatoda tepidariorum TaxID=114398 RepID=UPI0039BD58D2